MKPVPQVKPGLLRHSLDREVLVYDREQDRVHLLDPTTALILELLEGGRHTHEEIVATVAARLGVAPDGGFLTLALAELRAAGLIEGGEPRQQINRREMVARLAMTGAAAALIPAVATLTATTGYAQASQTNLPEGSPCTNDANCAAGLTCNTGNDFSSTCRPCQPDSNEQGVCNKDGDCCSGNCNESNQKCG